jgi:hypothetical protein
MKFLRLLVLVLPAFAADFTAHTIASDLKGGYQVVVADLNHDGKPDLIALGSGMSELVWYENPTWERHVLAGGFSRLINCVVAGDDIVVASEFSNQAAQSPGVVSVLHREGDKWTVREIDRLPTSHRLRLADIDGSGKPVVISAPLTAATASGPDYRGQTPLVYYKPGEWKRRMISEENTGIVHCIYIVDWDGSGRESILTASFTGIHRFQMGKDGRWTRTEIAKGDPAAWPKGGSSDVAVGDLGGRFLAAIEPWHGNQVAVYRKQGDSWARQVIDTSLVDGHTILTADFDGDGRDQIVAGFRGQGKSVYIYTADASGQKWTKRALDDGGMGAAACVAADLNGDERPDIACIDATRLKWYENVGRN